MNNSGIPDFFGNGQSSSSQSTSQVPDFFQSTNKSSSTVPDFFNGVMPQDVKNAEEYLGQGIDQGMCEAFASQMTNGQKWGATSADAFQNQLQQGLAIADPTLSNMPIGSKIYWKPSPANGGNGHTAIYMGNNQMISADYDKVSINNISAWEQNTGMTPSGYVPVSQ